MTPELTLLLQKFEQRARDLGPATIDSDPQGVALELRSLLDAAIPLLAVEFAHRHARAERERAAAVEAEKARDAARAAGRRGPDDQVHLPKLEPWKDRFGESIS